MTVPAPVVSPGHDDAHDAGRVVQPAGSGRVDAAVQVERVDISGDEELGRRIVDSLAYAI